MLILMLTLGKGICSCSDSLIDWTIFFHKLGSQFKFEIKIWNSDMLDPDPDKDPIKAGTGSAALAETKKIM